MVVKNLNVFERRERETSYRRTSQTAIQIETMSEERSSAETVDTSVFKLPEYTPLNSTLFSTFESLFFNRSVSEITTQQLEEIQTTSEQYINYIVANKHLRFDVSVVSLFADSLANVMKSACEVKRPQQSEISPI